MSIIVDSRDDAVSDAFGRLLAARLRREREQRNWSIAQLADASGVSRAMISKVERAEASPTAALLGRLSGAFGLTISALLARAEADGTGGRIARASEQQIWTDPGTGYVRRALSPAGADPELVLVDMPAGAAVAYPASSYSMLGGQSIWVLRGRLTVREGAEENILKSGDCLTFDLAAPKDCALANPSSDHPVRYLVAIARR